MNNDKPTTNIKDKFLARNTGKIEALVIAGPTASGKTSLGVRLAEILNGEIVSADSMQIYKMMDIGTAKPTKEETRGITHHMIDFVDPLSEYSVADYVVAARKIIRDIWARGKTPIVVGGTGLYISSLVENVSFTDEKNDPEFHQKLEEIAQTEGGADTLYNMLRECDPEAADANHPNNVKRVLRMVEMYHLTGKTLRERNEESRMGEDDINFTTFAIEWDREVLYDRINRRVDIMMDAGLWDEAERVRAHGMSRTAMGGIGYKELFEAMDGRCTKDEAIEAIKQGSRNYAKRQLTWFRRPAWVQWGTPEEILARFDI